MQKIVYNKLVRDKIPELIEKSAKEAIYRPLTDEEYPVMLDVKLFEELGRYQDNKSVEELAGLLEVILAVADSKGCTREDLEKIRIEKAERCGSFNKRILLEEVIEK